MLHPLLEESELRDREAAAAAQILHQPKLLMTLAHILLPSFSPLSEFSLQLSWARCDRSECGCLQAENEGRRQEKTNSSAATKDRATPVQSLCILER